jgi:hypothetical protein
MVLWFCYVGEGGAKDNGLAEGPALVVSNLGVQGSSVVILDCFAILGCNLQVLEL